jgi:tripartite-type tricarboxylate transporter receptor subunit TctC
MRRSARGRLPRQACSFSDFIRKNPEKRSMPAFRTALRALSLAIPLAAALAQPAMAQQAPHTVTLVVGFAAGGVSDTIARIVAQKLAERTGQKVIVENRGGAGGGLAARYVSTSQPDGSVILVTTTSLAVNESMARNKGYKLEDLRTVAISASTPDIFAVNSNNPAKDLGEFLRNGKTKPINYGTAGVGSSQHIAAEYFFREIAKVPATHIPFSGGGPVISALLGGHVDMYSGAMPAAAPQVNDGQLRGLAVTSSTRNSAVKNVPTLAEAGFGGFTSEAWIGFFAPAKMPDAQVAKLNSDINEILKSEEAREKLKLNGFEPNINTHVEADARFKAEVANWGKMVRSIGLAAE